MLRITKGIAAVYLVDLAREGEQDQLHDLAGVPACIVPLVVLPHLHVRREGEGREREKQEGGREREKEKGGREKEKVRNGGQHSFTKQPSTK